MANENGRAANGVVGLSDLRPWRPRCSCYPSATTAQPSRPVWRSEHEVVNKEVTSSFEQKKSCKKSQTLTFSGRDRIEYSKRVGWAR